MNLLKLKQIVNIS